MATRYSITGTTSLDDSVAEASITLMEAVTGEFRARATSDSVTGEYLFECVDNEPSCYMGDGENYFLLCDYGAGIRPLAHGPIAPETEFIDEPDYADMVLTLNPSAYYRLGETDGLSGMLDSSGNSRDGTFIGTPVFGEASLVTLGDANLAIRFESAEGGEMPASAVPNLSQPFSVAFWVSWTGGGIGKEMVSLYDGTNYATIGCGYSSGGMLGFGTGIGTSLADWLYNVGSNFNNGTRHFVVAVHAGSNSKKLYVDGVDTSGTAAGGIWAAAVRRIALGYYGGLPSTIDEVAIFPAALTAQQVQDLWDLGK